MIFISKNIYQYQVGGAKVKIKKISFKRKKKKFAYCAGATQPFSGQIVLTVY